MSYKDKLSDKPIQHEINDGTYLVGVQKNEEGKDVVVRVPAVAIDEFKNKKAEEAEAAAQSSALAASEAAEEAQAAAESITSALEAGVSNALRGTVFGETVSVSDVSPIEHDLRVKVNSKNLFHFVKDTNVTFNGLKITAVANSSSFTADGTSTYSSIIGYPFSPMLLPAGTYTLSISDVPFSDKEGDDRIHINGKNLLTGSSTVLAYILFDGTKKKTTFTITETWEVFVNFLFSPGRTWESQEFTVQLEKGTEASEYAPYVDVTGVNITLSDGENEQTATSDADGNVTGLISASPSMTLTSDTENVIIECEYNRDLMKVIEELTQAIISLGGNI